PRPDPRAVEKAPEWKGRASSGAFCHIAERQHQLGLAPRCAQQLVALAEMDFKLPLPLAPPPHRGSGRNAVRRSRGCACFWLLGFGVFAASPFRIGATTTHSANA